MLVADESDASDANEPTSEAVEAAVADDDVVDESDAMCGMLLLDVAVPDDDTGEVVGGDVGDDNDNEAPGRRVLVRRRTSLVGLVLVMTSSLPDCVVVSGGGDDSGDEGQDDGSVEWPVFIDMSQAMRAAFQSQTIMRGGGDSSRVGKRDGIQVCQ